MKEELRSRALMFGVARKELKDIQSLAVLAGPTFMYTFLSCALLLAIKFTLSATVLDRNDGMPYSDELKAFGFFLTLCPRNLIANLYAKKKFWFNPHVDHLLVLGPIIMLGPLVWIFSTISFVKATYCLFLGASILPICGSPFIYWIEGDRLFARLKLWVSQYAAIWMVFVLNMFAGLVFLELSRSATETQGLRSLKGMGKTVFGFGIGFPILRYFSLQASRRGLKMYQVTEPANAEEENNVKKIIFTFIAR
ncbi:hypothetical protein BC829DRAFT_28077 [Chytridium lagenaria]|nr:hypothetical protein BC829DRAFT_28077 [Chytridium lagenaria]